MNNSYWIYVHICTYTFWSSLCTVLLLYNDWFIQRSTLTVNSYHFLYSHFSSGKLESKSLHEQFCLLTFLNFSIRIRLSDYILNYNFKNSFFNELIIFYYSVTIFCVQFRLCLSPTLKSYASILRFNNYRLSRIFWTCGLVFRYDTYTSFFIRRKRSTTGS